jgi:hypothetical protein
LCEELDEREVAIGEVLSNNLAARLQRSARQRLLRAERGNFFQ